MSNLLRCVRHPDGAVLALHDGKLLTIPCPLNLEHGNMHFFQLGKIPSQPNLRLSVAQSVWTIVPEVEKLVPRRRRKGKAVPSDSKEVAGPKRLFASP